ncbi:MAG: TIGR04551 family protein [Polyangiaceae bacterium]|nr:TIGR04551 family protein [Polyangiaceae bacterium]
MGEPKPTGATKAGEGGAAAAGAGTQVATDGEKTEGAPGEGEERTQKGEVAERPSEVYAEDWWTKATPVFDLHGYYRVRAELFHNFALGRKDVKAIWPQPPDNDFIDAAGNRHQVALCGDDPLVPEACESNTQAGANMRFRFAPELHISDNLRIMTQVDLLDNVVLGSTPDGYVNEPSSLGGYHVVARGGYSPTGAFVSTQWAPVSGVNSLKDSITVKRVWGEYATPIGQLRFGRMPSHWGIGMLVNGGEGYDADYQSTSDRLMFVTGVKAWDLYFGAAWDFANEGAISAAVNEQQGQPYDLAQKDDVDQYVFIVVRKMNPELQRKALREGQPVFNGGTYFVYRRQGLVNELACNTGEVCNDASLGQSSSNVSAGYLRRGAEAFIPDSWFQFMYKGFRFDVEAALIWGSMENTSRLAGTGTDYRNPDDTEDPGWKIRQFGIAGEAEFRAIEDRLRIGFASGYATGDDDLESLVPTGEGLQPQLTANRTYSEFRFHPNYRVDLILFRNILQRVQGAYYFKPSVEYDFLRDPDGQRVGAGAGLIWSRASEFMQTPGHARDLGVEIDLKAFYQAKDGVMNDDPDKMGGFFTQVDFGVLFPLDGLGFLQAQKDDYAQYDPTNPLDTKIALMARWFLGILY